MNMVLKAKESFNSIPNEIRKKFDHSPAKFLDYLHNPDNKQQIIDWGLANPPPPPSEPIEVRVTNPETPPPPGEAG